MTPESQLPYRAKQGHPMTLSDLTRYVDHRLEVLRDEIRIDNEIDADPYDNVGRYKELKTIKAILEGIS